MYHIREGAVNSTSSRWNADASELNSSWSTKLSVNSKVNSKQELYFVKGNYEIFSTEVSAREK